MGKDGTDVCGKWHNYLTLTNNYVAEFICRLTDMSKTSKNGSSHSFAFIEGLYMSEAINLEQSLYLGSK